MDPARWARIKEVFQAAQECDAGRRDAVVRQLCAGDDSLCAAVEAMLARESQASGFLESPALEVEAKSIARGLDAEGASSLVASPRADHAPSAPPVAGPGRARAASTRPAWWIVALAAVFLADLLLKTWCLILGPEGLGLTTRIDGGSPVIADITPGGPAARAGMRVGDVLIAFDGQPAARMSHRRVIRANLEIGRVYHFDLERNGQRLHASIDMPRMQVRRNLTRFVVMLWQIIGAALLATAVLIAFVRSEDPVALTGALTLASLSVGLWLLNLPPGYAVAWRSAPAGSGALLWIPNTCVALMGPIGLSFFASFPRPLFRSRRPRLLLWLPALLLLPFQLHALFLLVYRPDWAFTGLVPWVFPATTGLFAAYGLAMLAAIAANYARLTDRNEQRRLRVLVAGGAAGTLPALLRLVVIGLAPESALHDFLMSPGPDTLVVLAFLLFPISFAYAVLKHRILGIDVILRLGVQYALARGVVLSLVPVLGLVLVADALVHGDQPLIRIVEARGWVYALLAGLALAVHTQRRRWAQALDRRFFRDQYDARRLLREVAEQARQAGSLERAGPAVVARIEAALHPEFAALFFRAAHEPAFRCIASAPAGHAPPPLDAWGSTAGLLRAAERPLELTAPGAPAGESAVSALEWDELRRARIDLLLPIAMGAGRHEALLAFGPKRSEEPFTRDDIEELEAIAASLVLLVEGPTPSPDHRSSAFEECPLCGTCYDSGAARCDRGHAPLVGVGMPRTLGGRYRLEQRLGRGGMGTVYAATDVALGRRVAVKVVRDEWVHNAMAAQRFRREARAVAGFAHPNVVTVYDYGVEVGSRAFLVMELLEGATLRDVLRRGGPLAPSRVPGVLRGACSAVGAAHERGFIHRDLKPENIFLTDGGPVKVLDFGVVKPLAGVEGADPGGGPDTEIGVLVGTVGYMSPEQLLGDSPDVSWDLWSLAVVAYESLSGTLPFPVVSREAWRRAVATGRPDPLSAHLASPPSAWQAFFDRALAVDRGLRPRTAADLFRQLERALA